MIDPLTLAGLGAGFGLNIASDLFGNKLGRDNAEYQLGLTKDLQQWQWDNFSSPKAQVRSLAAAGINPNAIYGQQGSAQAAAPTGVVSPVSPVQLNGVEPLGNFLKNLSEVDVNKAKIPEIEASAKNLLTDVKAKELEYELRQRFGNAKMSAEVALAQQSLRLAYQNGDLNEIEKEKKTWEAAKEKALAGVSESQRDILKKQLGNIDKQIEQENKLRDEQINTEKSRQSSNYASARASNASADYTESQKKYQDIVNDIKESGKTFELENLIRGYQAENKVNDAAAEQAFTMLARYRQLNQNDKNAAARYLNYMFWFIKEQMPNLPVVPYIKGN